MQFLNEKRTDYGDYYYFDAIDSSKEILELLGLLKDHITISHYSVEMEHDHTSEGRPIECSSDEELESFLSSTWIANIDCITFYGEMNGKDMYGNIIPRTAILVIHR